MLAVNFSKVYYHFWWYIVTIKLVLVAVLAALANASDCCAIFVQFMKEHTPTELIRLAHSIKIPSLSLFWIAHECWQLSNDYASIYY